jgi:hypothetical protein
MEENIGGVGSLTPYPGRSTWQNYHNYLESVDAAGLGRHRAVYGGGEYGGVVVDQRRPNTINRFHWATYKPSTGAIGISGALDVPPGAVQSTDRWL